MACIYSGQGICLAEGTAECETCSANTDTWTQKPKEPPLTILGGE